MYKFKVTHFFLGISLLTFSLSSCNDRKVERVDKINDTETADKAAKEQHGQKRHVSSGTFTFKLDGTDYSADRDHAKVWKAPGMDVAMAMAQNNTGMSVSMQLYITGKGDWNISGDKSGGVSITVNSHRYWLRSPGNYLNIHVDKANDMIGVVLLSGSFEGVLEDKDGRQVKITDGQFTTESI